MHFRFRNSGRCVYLVGNAGIHGSSVLDSFYHSVIAAAYLIQSAASWVHLATCQVLLPPST